MTFPFGEHLPFGERLAESVRRTGTCAVVGLDPHLNRLPEALRRTYADLSGDDYLTNAAQAVVLFNRMVIDAAAGQVPAVKPQFAFYEALGWRGWRALEETCRMARDAGLLIIADAKRGDISSTAEAYAQAILAPDGPIDADAITINPWMGIDTLAPFVDMAGKHGKGVFVLVRTSNSGSAFLQQHGRPTAAARVAETVAAVGAHTMGPSGLSSIGAVMGAQAPEDARALRARMPAAWFLVPGVGSQGGSARDALAGARPDGLGCAVNSSRGVLFPPPGQTDDDAAGAISARVADHAKRFLVR